MKGYSYTKEYKREKARLYRERELAKDPIAYRKRHAEWERKRRERVGAENIYSVIRGRNRERRLELMERLGGSCVLCGFADERALQFDHIIPIKNRHAPRITQWIQSKKWRDVLGEFDKVFQLLCANCHAIKTAEERRKKAA